MKRTTTRLAFLQCCDGASPADVDVRAPRHQVLGDLQSALTDEERHGNGALAALSVFRFEDARSIEVNELNVLRITFDANEARVRIAANLTVIDAESGKPIEPFRHMQRSMRFVKEAGEW